MQMCLWNWPPIAAMFIGLVLQHRVNEALGIREDTKRSSIFSSKPTLRSMTTLFAIVTAAYLALKTIKGHLCT